jgi:hypothetical protein
MRTLTLLTLAALGCAARPPDPRAELAEAGVEYTAEAFVLAAGRGDTRVVALFLDAGMDPEVVDTLGRTPLIASAHGGSTDVAAALLARGARVTGCSRSPAVGAASPLHAAAVHGQEVMVALLLEHGADPRAPCLDTTPANEAARFQRDGVVRLLVARGAEVTWDPLRERAREAAARWTRVAETFHDSTLARGVIRRVLPRTALPEVGDRLAAQHTYLAQLLDVDVGSPAIVATSTTTFDRPGPFALRVRALGTTPAEGGEVPLLVEDLHHEASRFVLDHARRDLHAPYFEYARSLLPRAVEQVEAAGPEGSSLSRAERALLALPGVVEAELARTKEPSILAAHLPAFARALGACPVLRRHRLGAGSCAPAETADLLAEGERDPLAAELDRAARLDAARFEERNATADRPPGPSR